LPFLRNHFSTIGVNGMNELIRNFTGDKHDITDAHGMEMSLDILDHMRERMVTYQEESGNLYNLEATPAEGTTYRLAREDKKRYPDILQAGQGENIYYTNSSQIPADHTEDPFEALDLQNKMQCKYTGGTVLHLYMNEKLSDTESCKRFVKKVIENYQLPYITVTPVFSTCEEHGYLNGEQPECPECGEKTKVWTRVMGYFRPVDSFNTGKKGEHRERKHFLERRIESADLFGGL
jgi:ribonucleoside-triphosphate reductase